MKEVRKIARAKINLALDVSGKRANGYHDVSMIMQTVTLHDKLRLKKIELKKVLMDTNLAYLPTDDRNLVVRIAKHMIETYQIDQGVYIDLYKVIPVGAGLAGGSTDAAQTIIGMNELFELNLTESTMLEIGAKFGADIPYCILGGTALAEGIGEVLTPITPLMKLYLVIAKPKVSVSTAYVYENLDVNLIEDHPDVHGMIGAIEQNNLKEIISRLGNVLEDVTIKGYPEVAAIKKAMMDEGALGAMMSGSGSAVFGIFSDKSMAHRGAVKLKKNPLIRHIFESCTYNK